MLIAASSACAGLGGMVLIEEVNDFPFRDRLLAQGLKMQEERMKLLERLFLANLERNLWGDVFPTLER